MARSTEIVAVAITYGTLTYIIMLCIPSIWLQLKGAEASVDRLSLYLELSDPSSQSDGLGGGGKRGMPTI